MGNSGVKSSFEENNWRKIATKDFRSILYNDLTMKSIEQHEAISSISEDEIEHLWQWRSKLPQDSCVVDLYEYGIKNHGACSGLSETYVITQRIHLLRDIGSYSKAEAFLIIRDVTTGLKTLFNKVGAFTPMMNTIGINSEGRAKVWLNENFAQLERELEDIQVETSELGAVNNLVNLVSARVYEDRNFPIDYPRNLNFDGVHRYIKEVFSKLKGFQVDRVYLDRTEFKKNYHELRLREEKQQKSRMIASEAYRRLREIQLLHEQLKLQQQELQEREKKFVQPPPPVVYPPAGLRHSPSQLYHPPLEKVLASTSETERKELIVPTPQARARQEGRKIGLPPLPPRNPTKMKGQIEMVDSMILMHNEGGEGNERYEESRIIIYKF